MMDTYSRGGRAHVYWLQLPQARGGFFRRAYPAVNRGLRRAVRGRREKVHVVALNKFFTSRGRYLTCRCLVTAAGAGSSRP